MKTEHSDARSFDQGCRTEPTHKKPRRSPAKRVEIDASKVGKLLRLLGSDKPGEVAAAAAALSRTLQAAGLDLHDLAVVAERGLQPEQQPLQQRQRGSCGPPLPPDDWSAMAWWLHFHKIHLRKDQAEFVAGLLLGVGFEDDGRIREWQLQDLRTMIGLVRAAIRSTSVSEVQR